MSELRARSAPAAMAGHGSAIAFELFDAYMIVVLTKGVRCDDRLILFYVIDTQNNNLQIRYAIL
jgi:hypothetical protein